VICFLYDSAIPLRTKASVMIGERRSRRKRRRMTSEEDDEEGGAA